MTTVKRQPDAYGNQDQDQNPPVPIGELLPLTVAQIREKQRQIREAAAQLRAARASSQRKQDRK